MSDTPTPPAPPCATCVVYGASDDLIEVEGAIREEFGAYGADETYRYMAFSDGTVLKVDYTREGCWEFRRVAEGTARYEHRAHDNDKTSHTDRVTLTGDIRWVVVGEGFANGE